MKKVYVNPEWTFKETVNNLKALKNQYEDILRFFCYYDLKQKIKFKKKTRDSVYSLKLEEWEKDKVWNYLNGFELLSALKNIASRRNK